MKQPIDFMNQLTEHIIWNVRLRCFLDNGECISEEEAVSSDKCILGHWLANEGLINYRHIIQIKELDAVHVQMHKQVKEIIVSKISGDSHKAEAGMIILQKINEKVIVLLTKLDQIFENYEKED